MGKKFTYKNFLLPYKALTYYPKNDHKSNLLFLPFKIYKFSYTYFYNI